MQLIVDNKESTKLAELLLHLKHSLDFSKRDKLILKHLVRKYDVKPYKSLPWILNDKPFQKIISTKR